VIHDLINPNPNPNESESAMPALFVIENGTRTGQTIEKRSVAALSPGDVARGVIDGRPITGRPVTVLSVERVRVRRIRRAMRVAYSLPNGSAGVKFLSADAPVSIET
jgi:hypothetical protein